RRDQRAATPGEGTQALPSPEPTDVMPSTERTDVMPSAAGAGAGGGTGAGVQHDTVRLDRHSRLFTGSLQAVERSKAFSGPGQEVIEEREHTAEGLPVQGDDEVNGEARPR